MRIFKYPIAIADKQEVDMPKGASILCCQVQVNRVCLWAAVDPGVPLEPRTILMVGTGKDVTFDLTAVRYIGTIQNLDGTLVFHVFEPVE